MSLQLDPENYAIAGSGPLFARGWIDDPSDLDIVARGSVWDTAVKLGKVAPAPYSDVQHVTLFNGDIDILNGWFPECWPVNQID